MKYLTNAFTICWKVNQTIEKSFGLGMFFAMSCQLEIIYLNETRNSFENFEQTKQTFMHQPAQNKIAYIPSCHLHRQILQRRSSAICQLHLVVDQAVVRSGSACRT